MTASYTTIVVAHFHSPSTHKGTAGKIDMAFEINELIGDITAKVAAEVHRDLEEQRDE